MHEARLDGAYASLATWCAIALWQLCARAANASVCLHQAASALIAAMQQTEHEHLRMAALGAVSIMLNGGALIGQLSKLGAGKALHQLASGRIAYQSVDDRLTATRTLHAVDTLVNHPEDADDTEKEAAQAAQDADADADVPAADEPASKRAAVVSAEPPLDELMVLLLSDASPKLRAVGCRGIARSAQRGKQQLLVSIHTPSKLLFVLKAEAHNLLAALAVPPYDQASAAALAEHGASSASLGTSASAAALAPSAAAASRPTTAASGFSAASRPLTAAMASSATLVDSRPASAKQLQAEYEAEAPELLRDALNAALNLSGAKCAQVPLQVHGLTTLLEVWHAAQTYKWGGELALFGEMAGETLANLAQHPGNRTPMYRAELSLKTAAWSGAPLNVAMLSPRALGAAKSAAEHVAMPAANAAGGEEADASGAAADADKAADGSPPPSPAKPDADDEGGRPPDPRKRYLEWLDAIEAEDAADAEDTGDIGDIEGMTASELMEPHRVLLARAAFCLMDANEDGELSRLEMVRAFRQDERVRELLLPLLPMPSVSRNSVTGVDLQVRGPHAPQSAVASAHLPSRHGLHLTSHAAVARHRPSRPTGASRSLRDSLQGDGLGRLRRRHAPGVRGFLRARGEGQGGGAAHGRRRRAPPSDGAQEGLLRRGRRADGGRGGRGAARLGECGGSEAAA